MATFQHNPHSPGYAITLAVAAAHDLSGGVPDAPVELTRAAWDHFWRDLAAPESQRYNPPPAELWQTLLAEFQRRSQPFTADWCAHYGDKPSHTVTTELARDDVVRVTFSPREAE